MSTAKPEDNDWLVIVPVTPTDRDWFYQKWTEFSGGSEIRSPFNYQVDPTVTIIGNKEDVR